MRMLGGWPLKAEAIAIWVFQVQLLHTVAAYDRLGHIQSGESQLHVGGLQIPTTKKECRIAMRHDPGRIRMRRSFVRLVQGVEHDLRIVLPQECPVTLIPGPIRRDDGETKHITVERECFRHVEDPQQGTNAFNLRGHRRTPHSAVPTASASAASEEAKPTSASAARAC